MIRNKHLQKARARSGREEVEHRAMLVKHVENQSHAIFLTVSSSEAPSEKATFLTQSSPWQYSQTLPPVSRNRSLPLLAAAYQQQPASTYNALPQVAGYLSLPHIAIHLPSAQFTHFLDISQALFMLILLGTYSLTCLQLAQKSQQPPRKTEISDCPLAIR